MYGFRWAREERARARREFIARVLMDDPAGLITRQQARAMACKLIGDGRSGSWIQEPG